MKTFEESFQVFQTKIEIEKYEAESSRIGGPKSYEIFGIDFMVTPDFHPILLEFNDSLGWKGSSDRWRKVLLDNMVQVVLDPIFPPKRKSNAVNKFRLIF